MISECVSGISVLVEDGQVIGELRACQMPNGKVVAYAHKYYDSALRFVFGSMFEGDDLQSAKKQVLDYLNKESELLNLNKNKKIDYAKS